MITTNKPNIREIRETLGFNERLARVSYEQNTGLLRFKYWMPSHGVTDERKEADFFEMGRNGYDYAAFDEFAYRCIDDFDSESMTDAEIIDRSKKVYRAAVKFFQRPIKFQKFLSDSQKRISKNIVAAKANSCLSLILLEAERRKSSFQPMMAAF